MFSAVASRLAGLRTRYAEPHRAYHTQTHVDAMLAGLRDLPLAMPDAAELAVWYHDAIYDPAAADNEARSAALMAVEMVGLADPSLLDAARQMILATADHRVPDGAAADCALFLDLDMAILGAPPAAYDAYERGIAAEYVPVHGAVGYRKGRAAFLRGMLARPRLFHTERFHTRLDAAARDNMRRAS